MTAFDGSATSVAPSTLGSPADKLNRLTRVNQVTRAARLTGVNPVSRVSQAAGSLARKENYRLPASTARGRSSLSFSRTGRRLPLHTNAGGRLTTLHHALRRHPAFLSGLITAGVVFFVVFRTGRFLASGDVVPLMVDGLKKEIGWQWTHQNSGGGGPTYEIARLIEVVFVRLAQLLGGTETLGQRMLFSSIWAFTATSGAAVAARFTKHPSIVIALGLGTAFNPYTLIAQPNPLPILALGVVAAISAISIDAARGTKPSHRSVTGSTDGSVTGSTDGSMTGSTYGSSDGSRFRLPTWLSLALLTLPCSYIALNPPLLAMVAAAALLQPLLAPLLGGVKRGGTTRTLLSMAKAVPLAATLSAWWVVPAYIAIRAADPTAKGAVTNVEAWAWTHSRSSIANVLTMFGHWSWPREEYYGSAIAIQQWPWKMLRWVVPIGAILAPFVVQKARRRTAVSASALIVGAVVVGKGLHEPFAFVNRWLYANVPGFWLFREPAAKVGVFLVLLYIIGFALTADALVSRFRSSADSVEILTQGGRPVNHKRAVRVVGTLMLVSPLLGVWPLWTGSVIESANATRTGDRVALPGEWRTVARVINSSIAQGKTLVLPVNDYYQLPTTWGYYGADNLVRRLVTRPVIQSDPQLYVGDSDGFEALMRTAEKAIALNNGEGAKELLRVLGVSHVVVRKDIDFTSTRRVLAMTRPAPILAGLNELAGVRRIANTTVADVFEVVDRPGTAVEALSGIVTAEKLPPEGLALVRAALPDGVALGSKTSVKSLERGSAFVSEGHTPSSETFPPNGLWTITRRSSSAPIVRIKVTPTGFAVSERASWKIGLRELPNQPGGEYVVPGLVALQTDRETIDQLSNPPLVQLDSATSATPWLGSSQVTALKGNSGLLDCNNYDGRSDAALGHSVTRKVGRYEFELRARKHSACLKYPIANALPNKSFFIRVNGTSKSGSMPRFCVWLQGLNRCATQGQRNANGKRATGLRSDTSGTELRLNEPAIVTIPKGATGADLYLYADEPEIGADSETIISYQDPIVRPVKRGALIPIKRLVKQLENVSIPAGRYTIAASVNESIPSSVSSFGEVGDCDRSDQRSFAELGIEGRRFEQGIGLSARDHAACSKVVIDGVEPAVPYRISFEHRTVRGAKARYCVFDPNANRCLVQATLDASTASWTKESVTLDSASRKSAGPLQLYVYADGFSKGTTTEYRNVSVAPFVDEFLALRQGGVVGPAVPVMTFTKVSPARYRVKVANATKPFVLTLSDSWSEKWTVTGLPAAAVVDHLRIDGYRNGWAIDAKGDLDILIEYLPARAGQLAIDVSLLAALVALVLVFAGWIRGGMHHRPKGPDGNGSDSNGSNGNGSDGNGGARGAPGPSWWGGSGGSSGSALGAGPNNSRDYLTTGARFTLVNSLVGPVATSSWVASSASSTTELDPTELDPAQPDPAQPANQPAPSPSPDNPLLRSHHGHPSCHTNVHQFIDPVGFDRIGPSRRSVGHRSNAARRSIGCVPGGFAGLARAGYVGATPERGPPRPGPVSFKDRNRLCEG